MDPQALDQLKPMIQPDGVSAWPPALGWWLLVLFLIGLIAAGVILWRRWQQKAPLRQALSNLQQTPDDLDSQQLAVALNRQLKEFYVLHRGNDSTLTNPGQWQAYLQQLHPWFKTRDGMTFVQLPYQAANQAKTINTSEWLNTAHQTITAMFHLPDEDAV